MDEFLTVVHECADFDRWKPIYDADAPNRKAAGLTDLVVLRKQDNPNVIALAFGMSDRKKAEALITSPQLRETMKKAGIVGQPEFHFRQGEMTVRDAPLYLTLNCKIRDLAQFRKGYAMDKKDRENATLADSGVLTEIDDPTDLLLVWSLTDKASVEKFFASPQLAEHQVKNAGVTSKPLLRYWTK